MAGPRYNTVSLLTDYGMVDEFAGVLRSVVRCIAPHAVTIDITHDIAPFDVRAGSLVLVRSAHYLAPGVVVAVVDPGVGTDRRAIAVEVGDGESVLVGPDNGLLAPVVAMVGGAQRVVELTNSQYQLDGPGLTFAGRDVFAPAAAHLCNGVDLTDLGPQIDPSTLVPGLVPFSARQDDRVEGDVLWVDRYGNAQLNVTPEQVDGFGERLDIRMGHQTVIARRVSTFGELRSGEAGLLVDASGLLSLVLDQDSAGARWSITPDQVVVLTTTDAL